MSPNAKKYEIYVRDLPLGLHVNKQKYNPIHIFHIFGSVTEYSHTHSHIENLY